MRKKPDYEKYTMYGLLVIVLGGLIFNILVMFGFTDTMSNQPIQSNQMSSRISSMSLTGFDRELAKQFMDKDGDGRCDACGMDVNLCIDSGQLQCNMDRSSTIGLLGSQHIHADWKIYVNGKTLGFSDKSHMERMRNNMPVSSFIHVDSGAPAPEKTGDVIHMHASGVPLWIFFTSIGLDFNKNCITQNNNQQFCNQDSKRLKFYVNGKENNEFEKYVFNDMDKILISYGDENLEEINKQLSSTTNFAGNH